MNVHRSTHELLGRILEEGQAVPDLEEGPIPVLVSAFDVTRCEICFVLSFVRVMILKCETCIAIALSL